MALCLLPPLPASGSLVVAARVRAKDANGPLTVDLWGFDADDPRQQLSLQPFELPEEFQVVGSVWPSSSPTLGIWLRIYSTSTRPVEVDYIHVLHLPDDSWTRVATAASLGAGSRG